MLYEDVHESHCGWQSLCTTLLSHDTVQEINTVPVRSVGAWPRATAASISATQVCSSRMRVWGSIAWPSASDSLHHHGTVRQPLPT